MLIAILEDDERRLDVMESTLDELGLAHRAVFFDGALQMIAWLEENFARVSIVSLNHAARATRVRELQPVSPGTGHDVVEWLAARPPAFPVLLHSGDARARDAMQAALQKAGWTAEAIAPVADLLWIQKYWIRRVRELFGPGA